jgi:hypothetical protein
VNDKKCENNFGWKALRVEGTWHIRDNNISTRYERVKLAYNRNKWAFVEMMTNHKFSL